MYTPGHEREAARVARQLGIHNVEQVDANSRQIAGNASVVVVVVPNPNWGVENPIMLTSRINPILAEM